MTDQPLFERITVIGLGLIGSSIARAVKANHLAGTIIGCDENEISLAYARKHGFIDTAMHDAKAAVSGSDLVIIATPLSSLSAVAQSIAPGLRAGAIVMDTCSVKQEAIQAIAPHLPANVDFVPTHPIAGSEQSGVSAGRADMFERKRVIITPNDPSQKSQVLQIVTSFWQGMGAKLEGMPPHLHDMIYAYVSHLPQLLARIAAKQCTPEALASKSDELIQKFTRLSHSDLDLWIEIFMHNRENMLAALDRYMDVVAHITHELAEAPADSSNPAGDAAIHSALFPRIAASCLITTVMEAEKKAGFTFSRYAGTGFADFTYPASQPPDEDIESISNHHSAVLRIMIEYQKALKEIYSALSNDDAGALNTALTQR